jgi:hypothetical protein
VSARQKRESAPRAHSDRINCKGCDTFFEPNMRRQIYCSNRCRKTWESRVRRRQGYQKWFGKQRVCDCGVAFFPKRSNHAYCSRRCKRRVVIRHWRRLHPEEHRIKSNRDVRIYQRRHPDIIKRIRDRARQRDPDQQWRNFVRRRFGVAPDGHLLEMLKLLRRYWHVRRSDALGTLRLESSD